MPSTFKLSGAFAGQMRTLATGIDKAAHLAMEATVKQAEQDAGQMYRWHTQGEYGETDRAGNEWEWTVTGNAAASISGYVVGAKKLNHITGGTSTVYKNGVPFGPHSHDADNSLTGDYQEQPGVVQGIVTMNVGYALFLQQKEILGGEWGSPSPGLPVTIDVFDTYWDAYYVPHILEPTIARYMDRISARLR